MSMDGMNWTILNHCFFFVFGFRNYPNEIAYALALHGEMPQNEVFDKFHQELENRVKAINNT